MEINGLFLCFLRQITFGNVIYIIYGYYSIFSIRELDIALKEEDLNNLFRRISHNLSEEQPRWE